jgi:hypothetical protein
VRGEIMAVEGLELEILRDIPVGGRSAPRAYAVWTDRDGEIQMGPVRFRRVCTPRERLASGHRAEYVYQCSPFPGAWDNHVPESAFIRVRHLGALCLNNMECVCQGTEFDMGCPARDCKTVSASL